MSPKPYKTESELCAAFIVALRAAGYAVHPETSDFDILAVAPARHIYFDHVRFGDQLGIHAKLRANIDVLAQILDTDPTPFQPYSSAHRTGAPHWRVVLVPDASVTFQALCAKLGIQLARPPSRGSSEILGNWFRLNAFQPPSRRSPKTPCWVPDIELHTPSGVPSPKSITKWKLAALKLCHLGLTRGYLTKQDFKAAGVTLSTWTTRPSKQWVKGSRVTDTGGKPEYRYVLTEHAPHTIYPDIYASLVAGLEKETL